MDDKARIAQLEQELNAMKNNLNNIATEKQKSEDERIRLTTTVKKLEELNDRYLRIIENLSKGEK